MDSVRQAFLWKLFEGSPPTPTPPSNKRSSSRFETEVSALPQETGLMENCLGSVAFFSVCARWWATRAASGHPR